jgi:hypothetical protein
LKTFATATTRDARVKIADFDLFTKVSQHQTPFDPFINNGDGDACSVASIGVS